MNLVKYIDSAKETVGTITKFNNRKKKRNTCKFESQYYRKMKVNTNLEIRIILEKNSKRPRKNIKSY